MFCGRSIRSEAIMTCSFKLNTQNLQKSDYSSFVCLVLQFVVLWSITRQRKTSMVCVIGCLQSGQQRCWACRRWVRMSAQCRQRQRWRQGSRSTVLLKSWQMTHFFLSSCSFSRRSRSPSVGGLLPSVRVEFGRDILVLLLLADLRSCWESGRLGSFADGRLVSVIKASVCGNLVVLTSWAVLVLTSWLAGACSWILCTPRALGRAFTK